MSFAKIRELIQQHRNYLPTQEIEINDLFSLKHSVLNKELSVELAYLQLALNTPETFRDNFLARCKERDAQQDSSINFRSNPKSLTNRLYWEIAVALFHPMTMAQMLAIITPGIKNQLGYEIQFKPPRLETIQFIWEPKNLDCFNDPVELDSLLGCVLVDEWLLKVEQLTEFTLAIHRTYQSQLTHHYPKIAKKLYQHNEALQALQIDIDFINTEGKTPKEAIEQLIKGLRLGGNTLRGIRVHEENASIVSQTAYMFFIEYLNSLPGEIKDELLEFDNGALNAVLIQLRLGDCVDTASIQLQHMLERNPHSSLLNNPLEMASEQVTQLNRKYPNQLMIEKNHHSDLELPERYVADALRAVRLESAEDLIHLLSSFPTSYYKALWEYVPKSHLRLSEIYVSLRYAMNDGLFSLPEKQALAKAVCSSAFDARGKRQLLFAATQINYVGFMQSVCSLFTPEELFAELLQSNEGGKMVLHLIVRDSELLKAVLHSLKPENRTDAAYIQNKRSQMVFHFAWNNVASLRVLLGLWPINVHVKLLQITDFFGGSVLRNAMSNPQIMEEILYLLPPGDRLEAIKTKDENGVTFFCRYHNDPEALAKILKALPERERLPALLMTHSDGSKALHWVWSHVNSLRTMFELLPLSDRLTAVNDKNKYGDSLVHAAIMDGYRVIILELLREQDRLSAVIEKNADGDTVLHLVYQNAAELANILKLLPLNERRKALDEKNANGDSVWDLASTYPGSLVVLRDLLPQKTVHPSFRFFRIEVNLGDHFEKDESPKKRQKSESSDNPLTNTLWPSM